MKNKMVILFVLAVLFSACAAKGEIHRQDVEVPKEPTVPLSLPLIADAVYKDNGLVQSVHIPSNECTNVTASPTVIGQWLVYPMHDYGHACEEHSKYYRSLLGYNIVDGKLYQIYDGGTGEAPVLYQPDENLIYWNVTFGGTVLLFDAQTFEMVKQVGIGTTSDSGGAYLDGYYYFGTVNTPNDNCQSPINSDCGALVAIDAEGTVVHKLNTDDGFRSWIGTSVTTDGEYLYFGSAAQTVGDKSGDETEYLYGCSVIKTDKQLNVIASFDPGDLACYKQPFDGANIDSVGGEVVFDDAGLWVQYVRPNDREMVSGLYRLNYSLEEICRVEYDYEPQTQSVGFYTGPTIDRGGNAYVVISVPDDLYVRRGLLQMVSPDCRTTTLAEVPGSFAHATPTLADDQYILFATDGLLQILAFDGNLVQEYVLASQARVLTSPIIHEKIIYVLQEDGTLNIIENTGIEGYGDAIWPRYRHDNYAAAQH